MDKRINKAAIKIIEMKDYDIILDQFHDDWIVAKGYDGIHFIKVVYDKGKLPDPSHYMLMHEFEYVAAAWLRAVDPDDAAGDIHGDLMCFNIVKDDLGFVRYEHDAVDRR